MVIQFVFFFSSRRRHTRLQGDWSSDVCSSDLALKPLLAAPQGTSLSVLDVRTCGGRKIVRGIIGIVVFSQRCEFASLRRRHEAANDVRSLEAVSCYVPPLHQSLLRVRSMQPLPAAHSGVMRHRNHKCLGRGNQLCARIGPTPPSSGGRRYPSSPPRRCSSPATNLLARRGTVGPSWLMHRQEPYRRTATVRRPLVWNVGLCSVSASREVRVSSLASTLAEPTSTRTSCRSPAAS